jgi:FtsP/CotA-like multicopper oxidase with cupredoxin domain
MNSIAGPIEAVINNLKDDKAIFSQDSSALPRRNTMPNFISNESHVKIERHFSLTFSIGASEIRDGLSYKTYLMNHRAFSATMVPYTIALETIHEWTLESPSGSAGGGKSHPFHIHTNPFQIVAMSHGHGLDYHIGEWRDTITIPYGGFVKIRFQPRDFTGRILAHCHILGHSDAGMLMLVEIVPRKE